MNYIQLNSDTNFKVYICDDGTLWSTFDTGSKETRIINGETAYKKSSRIGTDGYLCTKVGRQYTSVHRLVAKNFVTPGRPDQIEVNHIDGNKMNNRASNLEWVNRKENQEHAMRAGLIKGNFKPTLSRWVCEYCEQKPNMRKQCVREDTDEYTLIYKKHGSVVKQERVNPRYTKTA